MSRNKESIQGIDVEREVANILSEHGKLTDILEELSGLRKVQDKWQQDEEAAETRRNRLEEELAKLENENNKLEEVLYEHKLEIWELKRETRLTWDHVQDLESDIERFKVCIRLIPYLL